jgi:hypothetical protein
MFQHFQQKVIPIQFARDKRAKREHERSCQEEAPKASRGGFIIDGHDAADLGLMNTSAGLNALRIFAKIGSLSPVYLSQEYFNRMSPPENNTRTPENHPQGDLV